MRLVLHGDLVAAARYLLPLPDPVRRSACRRLIDHAHAAHHFTRRTGRCHPLWGDGSLISAAMRHGLAAEPSLRDSDYCACLEMVLHEIVRWRTERQYTRVTRPRRQYTA
ncbi:hypothetical protein [Shimia biformata]|uniref:DUF7742 family protein n=1 Tax=Shimia biformata TaxID=1294299 RepID=UPI001950E9E4|nr:hypothetical protein [Shimia biformata]